MTTSPSDAPARPAVERSFDRTCPTHGWPLRAEGSCVRCEQDAERALRGAPAPCPAHTTWTSAFKRRLIELHQEASSPGTSPEAAAQRWWENKLHTVAGHLGLRPTWTTPVAEMYETLARRFAAQTRTTETKG